MSVQDFGNLIPRNYKTDYKVAVRGEGIYIYDEDGTPYIDGCSGALISSVGHGNRAVVDAIARQLETLEFAHPSRWKIPVVLEAASVQPRRCREGTLQLEACSSGRLLRKSSRKDPEHFPMVIVTMETL